MNMNRRFEVYLRMLFVKSSLKALSKKGEQMKSKVRVELQRSINNANNPYTASLFSECLAYFNKRCGHNG